MISVLLVEDQLMVRQGLRMRLGLEQDMQIVGEARDGIEAIELAHQLHPDIVLMDVEMPRMDGITATKAIRAIAPEAKVVVVSLHCDLATQMQAEAAGAVGFVAKHSGEEALLRTIRRVV